MECRLIMQHENILLPGLFDPHSPPQIIEPDKPLKIHLEPMRLWAGQWNVPGDLCTIYNLTVASELSSIGIFLRYSTMPTIVHYNHFDRILGRQLKPDSLVKRSSSDLPREAFPSMPSGAGVVKSVSEHDDEHRSLCIPAKCLDVAT